MSAVKDGFIETIGNTPLIRLRRASDRTGCNILGKAEFLNPGGSIKDRAARGIIEDAFSRHCLEEGGTIVEGTAGNTGIGLTLVGRARGCHSVIVMPETQSEEKKAMLRLCGARLHLVPAVPYKNPKNYVRYSETLAASLAEKSQKKVFWANQFDNCANREAHRKTTAQEIWEQTDGALDAFVCSVGTGGTIGGVSLALKEKKPSVRIVLADPYGSALCHYYQHGTLKAEGNSITEGIGQGRITANLEGITIDDAIRIDDVLALETLFMLAEEEGLILGGSSGINIAAAIRLARDMGRGHTIVTMLCDGGSRYQSKLFNPTFLHDKGLPTPPWLTAS
ncbi:MAG: cysteine synthase A [Alphaproteobacteria bacterium GM7ARS4]|nr:cysteine synthase A [Alphaproteobacteria bacterium GM7ARS4]